MFNKWYKDKEAETYFSLKLCCSCFSAAEKNSSISCELGMKRQIEVSILRRDVIELLVLLLVVDPGVLIISGFLIKLHGVVSLVLLQPKEAYMRKKNQKQCLKCTGVIAFYNFFSLLNFKSKSNGSGQKQTWRKATKVSQPHYSS